jgi:hypothetical protein
MKQSKTNNNPTATQLGLRTILFISILSSISVVIIGYTGILLAWVPLIAGMIVTLITAIWRTLT